MQQWSDCWNKQPAPCSSVNAPCLCPLIKTLMVLLSQIQTFICQNFSSCCFYWFFRWTPLFQKVVPISCNMSGSRSISCCYGGWKSDLEKGCGQISAARHLWRIFFIKTRNYILRLNILNTAGPLCVWKLCRSFGHLIFLWCSKSSLGFWKTLLVHGLEDSGGVSSSTVCPGVYPLVGPHLQIWKGFLFRSAVAEQRPTARCYGWDAPSSFFLFFSLISFFGLLSSWVQFSCFSLPPVPSPRTLPQSDPVHSTPFLSESAAFRLFRYVNVVFKGF